jgi:hypothetical protein
MKIRTRMCMSIDGCVTTPDGRPVQLADPTFEPGKSHGFPEFQRRCEAVLMGRTTFEPALGAGRWRGRTWTSSSSPPSVPPAPLTTW